MPSDLQEQIKERIAKFAQEVDRRAVGWSGAHDPVAFRRMELEVAAEARRLSDEITAVLMQQIVAVPTLQASAAAAVRSSGCYRDVGRRSVAVRLLGGGSARVSVEYLRLDRRGQRGRRRRSGRRGKAGSGVYPVLAALGIWFGVTPALCGEVCRQVADSDSVRAGRAALERRGLDLGHKQTLRIVNRFSARAVEQRDRWLARARQQVARRGPFSGRRVVVATDGGRLRERRPARHGRRRTDTGHRRYDAPWREPKLLTLYVIDDQGAVVSTYQPIYDGTLGDCDALFEMLLGYLKALGAHQARELIFVGDGAKWIWERARDLAQRLGVDPSRVREVIDWCHAVAVLHEVAEARVSWTEHERARWVRRAKKLLHAGNTAAVLEAIDTLAIGRNAKAVGQHRDYFARNGARMQYAAFVAANVPTGSGAVESAIRRVINMRMKSNGMFWLEVNAQGMLLLRSYLKANRFDALVDWSIASAVPWPLPPGAPASSPVAATAAS